MEDLGFKRRTYLPSTFLKKPLNFKRIPEITETVVVEGERNDHFCAIIEDVGREFKEGRAILIIFANDAELKM